jgi:glycosyltransferase involved in cell wall biosynthesis
VTISAIVPAHLGGETLARTLRCLLQTAPLPDELIVVADGSADAAEQARRLGARVLHVAERRGPAFARNLGAAYARGDVIVFVDADVLVPPDFFGRIAALFQSEQDLSAVIGSYDDDPGARNFLSQYKNLLHHFIHQEGRVEASTFWGACGAIRRSLFLSLGGFDERIPRPAMEDVEFGSRLRRAGYRIRLAKALQVKHLKAWDAWSLLTSDLFARAVPWTELMLRERQMLNDLNLRVSYRISVALVFILLATMIASFVHPGWLAISGSAAVVLLALNLPLYRFFLQKRGRWFTLRAIAWHWFSYAYSGVGFVLGGLRYVLGWRIVRPLDAAGAPVLQNLHEFDG